jgi:hypothetical protein
MWRWRGEGPGGRFMSSEAKRPEPQYAKTFSKWKYQQVYIFQP